MSLSSMTGYGRGSASANGLRVEVELSSVNRRQLDIHLSMPEPLRLLESRVQGEMAKKVARGRIVAEVAVTGSDRLKRDAIRINHDLAGAYLSRLRKAAAKMKLPDDLRASLLLTLPGVLHYEPLEDDVEKIWPALSAALQRALGELLRMRLREGAALQKDLERRVLLLAKVLAAIKKSAPASVRRYRDALHARLRTAGLDAATNGERLERELILFADKSDITEELTRLGSHLQQARTLLRSRDPSGRALDFLSQEMSREINTIGSKANDATISRHVVGFKAELERLREQVQNIE